jgi:hypothetical protein
MGAEVHLLSRTTSSIEAFFNRLAHFATYFFGTVEFSAMVTPEHRTRQDAPEASEARRGNGMAELLEANA